ncbi:rCG62885 [Rattus norvegicus]|uniref:RCG62885 n=1 Tax=Rattus norvegicus TaxID=10116 RepID=A6K5G2_RAT|nr:rCG62885 [Rattus norvegicus]
MDTWLIPRRGWCDYSSATVHMDV